MLNDRKSGESEAVSEANHRRGNSIASLQCARINKSIIYVTKQTASICKLSRRKTLKRGRFRLTDIRKSPGLFYCMTRASTLPPAIILLTLQEFPVSVQSIIHCGRCNACLINNYTWLTYKRNTKPPIVKL